MITVEVVINNGSGKAKTYQLTATNEVAKKKNGGKTLAHFQPAPENKVILPFSKLYIDTEALKK